MMPQVRAAYVLNINQSAGNVVASGTGSLNLAALTLQFSSAVQPGVQIANPGINIVTIGSAGNANFFGLVTGPSSFASGAPGTTLASSASGSVASVFAQAGNSSVGVPSGYVSGTTITGTATWNATTLAALGLTPGTYVYTWGSGGTADSLTLNISTNPPPVPIPSTVLLAAIGLAALLTWQFFAARRRQTAQV